MLSGSQLSISRVRLEPTPSIHTESELWIKKGSGPSIGSALGYAAAGVEQLFALVRDR